MKKTILFLLLFLTSISSINAQNDYLVNTSSIKQQTSGTEEELFVAENFPLLLLCDWKPGMKFMFMPTSKDKFIPILSNYEDGTDVNNMTLKQKIFEFIGTEEKSVTLSIGTTYNTHFVFQCEGKKFYHKVKDLKLDEICKDNPRRSINGLVYLKDVDTAKELLIGKPIYIESTTVRQDDPNSYSGYKDVTIDENSKATIKAIGVGSKSFPVKIIFEDEKGVSYYMEVAMSRTNSGMDIKDFQADKKHNLFSNAFSFTDKKNDAKSIMAEKYIGQKIYPLKNISVQSTFKSESQDLSQHMTLPRYTTLTIKSMDFIKETLVDMQVVDKNNRTYVVKTDLKYDVIIKNDNYIENMFALGDIQKQYSYITPEHWKMIAQGQVQTGMTMDECKLSLGEPIQTVQKTDQRFETWFYNGKTVEFESGRLIRSK